mmetsp:Transcript_51/g.175  ORF Transcript_51/g.175 Transcript_51/m.175 type:complete len:270 (+) Transcript_51:505-1314(+)
MQALVADDGTRSAALGPFRQDHGRLGRHEVRNLVPLLASALLLLGQLGGLAINVVLLVQRRVRLLDPALELGQALCLLAALVLLQGALGCASRAASVLKGHRVANPHILVAALRLGLLLLRGPVHVLLLDLRHELVELLLPQSLVVHTTRSVAAHAAHHALKVAKVLQLLEAAAEPLLGVALALAPLRALLLGLAEPDKVLILVLLALCSDAAVLRVFHGGADGRHLGWPVCKLVVELLQELVLLELAQELGLLLAVPLLGPLVLLEGG